MISDKIILLNETVLKSFNETDEKKIIANFTEVGIKVLEANYGFVWLNSLKSNKLELSYTSHNLPFNPRVPKEDGRNYKALRSEKIDYVTNTSYVRDAQYVSKYIKSFVIIPICYRENTYGNIIFCFKQKEPFPKEKKILCTFIGNSLAQAITIHRLFLREQESKGEIQRQKDYFQALIENSYEIEMLLDKKGIITYVSPSVRKFLGLGTEDVLGRSIHQFMSYEDPKAVFDYINSVINSPVKIHVKEFDYRYKDGSTRFLESTAYNMLNKPNVSGIVVNIRDITARKKLENEKENKLLLEEEEKKIAFMAEANHELRTPLAIIKGNVDLILHEAGASKRRYSDTAITQINDEVRHLGNILMDLSLLTTRHSEMQYRIIKKKIKLTPLLNSTIKRCKVIASKKKIKISARLVNLTVSGDEKYLERLFLNIITNAINYGKNKGSVKIIVKKEKNIARIQVIDNGIGISQADLPNIFSRFYRADKSHSSDERRTGLGLAICKWIVDAHMGKIKVESKLGKGSIFTIELQAI